MTLLSDGSLRRLRELLTQTDGMEEREDILKSISSHYTMTCRHLGYVLMTLKLPAERLKATRILASTIMDCENINADLIPYIAMESHANRTAILKCITNAHSK